ncbi:hypothetical protein Tco_1436928 [Tanacetum coccineum]
MHSMGKTIAELHATIKQTEKGLPKKVDTPAVLSIGGGYPKKTMSYYFYYSSREQYFVARNTEFFKNSLTLQEASGSQTCHEASGSDMDRITDQRWMILKCSKNISAQKTIQPYAFRPYGRILQVEEFMEN